ncbi:I78 family peptidase inhibitor [Sphingomonas sp. RP10(2022)]|uniref:I78 family peptidase inhibitor n=1 Tax=Sphingomonas liriopis TaxID=2949094 RepID=A0A9X2HUD6_9SPHN|nr:I78 family peptidase inhibitor [Sphingomonas liriopis]MCP3733669.1 I78 family peptidase inhibitor [Sphingomonas liriopis]
MMRKAWLMMLPVMAAGCTTMAEPPAPAGPCVISQELQMRYAGVKFRERLRSEIERTAHARTSRVLHRGDAATMDFRPDRLNIVLDDGNQIEGLRCG